METLPGRSQTIADDRKRPGRSGRSLTIGAIVKNQKRSNGNTLRRSGRSGRSKSIPESIIPVTIFRAFARRLPWSSRIFTKMAATSELNSSLFMEEVQKYECLYNKFVLMYDKLLTLLSFDRSAESKICAFVVLFYLFYGAKLKE